jgi:hypothetical protein
MVLFGSDIPGGLTPENPNYRYILFAVTLGCLWLALALNYLPPRYSLGLSGSQWDFSSSTSSW